MRSWIGSLALASGLLAGCQGKSPPAAAARSQPDPARGFAGLWEQSLTRDGRALPFVGRARICLGASTVADLVPIASGVSRRACDRTASQKTADGGERFALRCALGEGGVSEINGSLARPSPDRFTLREESVTTGSAAPALNGHHDVTVEGRWIGPCPAGMKPGELTLAGGFKVDLSRAVSAAKAMVGGGG